jgi:hypothetical protein
MSIPDSDPMDELADELNASAFMSSATFPSPPEDILPSRMELGDGLLRHFMDPVGVGALPVLAKANPRDAPFTLCEQAMEPHMLF